WSRRCTFSLHDALPICPFRVELVNCGRVNVGGRGNGAGPAIPHVGEEERFAADKYVKTGLGKRVEENPGVVPIARAVFHPRDGRSEEHTSELQSLRHLV